mmetsp:Transcript_38804/g.93930  ORF Transcript_38804/g.93930 Transcript_38804/m.93930 type:complete len:612 (-) Transcript_38804:10-1845(-)
MARTNNMLVMMDDGKLFHGPNEFNDGLISHEDDSQHPSIVNSVTNDEDDYGHGHLQQQQQQQHYYDLRHHQQPYRYPQQQDYCLSSSSSVAPTSQILPPPLPPPRNDDEDPRDEDNKECHIELPPQNGHHVTHAETAGDSAKPILHAGSYLIRYEHMMKVQQTEKMATLSHVQPIFEVLEKMIESFNSEKTNTSSNENCSAQHDDQADDLYDEDDDLLMDGSALLSKEIRVADLRKVLKYIQSQGGGNEEDSNSMFSQNVVVSSIDLDLIRMDSQMMLVLETICKSTPTSKDLEESDDQTSYISWAEMLQLYRVCVVGLQTLEILSTSPTIRERAKGRTLRMVSLFDHVHHQQQQKQVGTQNTSDIKQNPSKIISDFDRSELSNIISGADLKEEGAYSHVHHKSISLSERTVKGTGSFASSCVESKNMKALWKVVGLILLGLMVLVYKSYEAFSVSSLSVGESEQYDKPNTQGSLNLKPVELYTPQVLSTPNPLSAATASKVLNTSKVGNLKISTAETSLPTPQKNDLGLHTETTESHVSLALTNRSSQDVADRMLSKVGGTAAILYLALPLLSAGGIWAPATLLVTLGSLGGRRVGKWVETRKWRKQVKK